MKYPKQKLEKRHVEEILRRRREGETYESLAEAFMISRYAISDICRGKTWADDTEIERLRGMLPASMIEKDVVDVEELRRHYDRGLTAEEIGKEMGWPRSTISAALYRNGITKSRPQNTNRKGEDHSQAKLTEQDVIDILTIRLDGELTQREIAKLYGVDTSTIWAICSGKAWSHPEMKAIKFLRQKLKLAGIKLTGK